MSGPGRSFVVAGTDTGVGKTVFAAALAGALGARYWKPVQSGLEEETDTQAAIRLGRLPPERVHPEVWRLKTPASPHLSAEIDGVEIDPDALTPPAGAGPLKGTPLVIEGAGGLLVPLTRRVLYADVLARWGLPVILCARTQLGGINHALLSIEALRARGAPLLGVAFIGPEMADTERTICEMGEAKRLGRLPPLEPLTPDSLAAAFEAQFDRADFGGRASTA
ncbi:MAG: dethiobiotin synthase [Pseudomonadota bacterium]